MRLLLTGTGPASGFPVPGCPCATCRSAAPARPGSSLGGRMPRRPAELRLDFRTDDDSRTDQDHRTGGGYRLDVDGGLRESDGTAHRLQVGERLERPGIVVVALASAGGTVCLLVHPDGEPPLLWAPQAGALPPATTSELVGAGLGAVLLGPAPEADPDEPGAVPDLTACALSLSRLRAAGAVNDRTTGLLVGLGHRQGPSDRLAVRLAHWRVQAPPDGSRLVLGGTGYESAPAIGRTLVLGGSSSGKSGLAEDLLAAEPEVLYVATGPVIGPETAADPEWARRVRRHREQRPAKWRTEETQQVAALLAKEQLPILLDSVGTWLTGVLDRAGAWTDQEGWRERVSAETAALLRAWRARRAPLVAVSDEVGLGVVPATPAGRLFRDELGRLNRRLADESEQVLVVMAGRLLAPGSPASSADRNDVGCAGT